jgi:hypothetical protein
MNTKKPAPKHLSETEKLVAEYGEKHNRAECATTFRRDCQDEYSTLAKVLCPTADQYRRHMVAWHFAQGSYAHWWSGELTRAVERAAVLFQQRHDEQKRRPNW